jgi:hypothetical protein
LILLSHGLAFVHCSTPHSRPMPGLGCPFGLCQNP